MKNFLFLSFFFFFFSLANSIFAQDISPINVATTLDENGEVLINVENLYYPSAPKWKASFSKDSIVKTKKLDCSFVGRHFEEIFYMKNGKRDSLKSLIEIQEHKDLCPQRQKFDTISIVGNIKNQNGKSVEAEVILVKYGLSQKTYKTISVDGKFVFNSLDQEYYGLEARNTDMNCASGVSTADIVKIQRHILSIERFISPYQYLAADVNNDKKINSEDIKILRDMILGKISRWPNFLPAWIFIPKEWKFINNTVPWNSMPDAKKNIPLDCSKEVNYIAIKRGDVNDSNLGNFDDNELQSRGSYSEEEEANRNDLLIEEMERRPPREVMIYELNFLNGSGIRAFKKI